MKIRSSIVLAALTLAATGCAEDETGPIRVSAIGSPPAILNPNLFPLDAPSALLIDATAQGLVRFDAAGDIERALAQSWIVSDDGLRYTFRLRRTEWTGGGKVTAEQVVARLRSVLGRASRNPLKPIFGLVRRIEAMTEEVLEIELRAPRTHFLQLLAQPELAILAGTRGTGPYVAEPAADGSVLLTLPAQEEDSPQEPPVALRGERAAAAIARFTAGGTDLVLGGTAGDLPLARASDPPDAALQFDPVAGLFGFAFQPSQGPLAEPEMRRALAMAIDRDGIVASLAVPGLLSRATVLPPGLEEVPQPAAPDWAPAPLPVRRHQAARTVAARTGGVRLRLRIAMPDGPGYRIIFAHLRKDWRAIGVDAERVAADVDADIHFVDSVAPATMTAWYLRHFTCERSRLCSLDADAALAAARETSSVAERRALLAKADGMITNAVLFVPIAAPVRWSLVSARLTGFRRNPFGRHTPGELIARPR